MHCVTCKDVLTPSAHFCPSCGAPTPINAAYKAARGLDCFWLEEVLHERGYSIQVDPDDPDAWRATAPGRPDMDFAYSAASRLIIIVVEKKPEDPSPFGKIKGFQYLNAANNGLHFWKARWDDEDNTIYFSFILAVSDVNARERIHAIACPVIDEMISSCA